MGLAPFAVAWVYLVPLIIEIRHAFGAEWAAFVPAILRSLAFAVAGTFLAVPTAFVLSFMLWRSTSRSAARGGYWMMPALTGSVVWAFVWKLIMLRSPLLQGFVAERSPAAVWSLLLVIQVWELAPAFVFLYWLGLRSVAAPYILFGEPEGRSFLELVRDVLWPKSRGLTFLLVLFTCAHAFQEYAKPQIILRASEATSTELVSHRLARHFEFYLPANPQLAVNETLAMGGLIALIGLVTALCVTKTVKWLLSQGTRIAGAYVNSSRYRMNKESTAGRRSPVLVLTCLILSPFVVLLLVHWSADRELIFRILRAALASTVCGSAAVGLAFCAATMLRLSWPDRFASTSAEVTGLSAGALAVHFVPAIAMSLTAFYWFGLMAPQSPGTVKTIAGWFIGELTLVFPLLAIFMIHVNFAVTGREVRYSLFHGATSLEIIRDSFWLRLSREYAVVWLFGFSFVFTEATLNSVVSEWNPWTPSVVAELLHRVDGRAASYWEAATLVIAAVIPILVTVVFLVRALERREAL